MFRILETVKKDTLFLVMKDNRTFACVDVKKIYADGMDIKAQSGYGKISDFNVKTAEIEYIYLIETKEVPINDKWLKCNIVLKNGRIHKNVYTDTEDDEYTSIKLEREKSLVAYTLLIPNQNISEIEFA